MKNILLKSMAVVALATTVNVALADVPDPDKATAGMIGRHEANGGVDKWVDPEDGIYSIDTWAKDANDWDSQFFIVIADEAIPAETQVDVSFDYKSEEDTVVFNAQGHGNPHTYLTNDGWDKLTARTDKWQTYTGNFKVTASTQSNHEGETMRTLAVNASIAKTEATLQLANIVVKINNKAVVKTKAVDTKAAPATTEPVVETDLQGWDFNGKATVVYEQVSGVTVFVSGASNTWDAQFNPPCWIAPAKKEGTKFKITFDAKYVGESSTGGYLTMIQGGGIDPRYKALDAAGQAELVKALLGEEGAAGIDAAWKLQNALDELIVDSASVVNGVCKNGGKLTRNVEFTPTAEWQTFSFEGTIGKNGCDSVDLEFEFGKTGFNGTYGIRNFKFEVNGKVFDQEYFVPKEVGPVAVEEVAAINAYVANGVLYASAATDVVIYNISGVAVKAAKNVTTLNVADLKSGLYIAKVGNKAIKFVK